MILGFDIGNSSTVMGIYNSEDIIPCKTFRYNTVRTVGPAKLADIIRKNIKEYGKENNKVPEIEGIAISSVVKEVMNAYSECSKKLFKEEPLVIGSRSELKVKLNYDNPEELGPDRIVNAEAAFNEYHEDCIIVDLGTATTFCVLLGDGTFDGGLITPGIGLSIETLVKKTSRLITVDFTKAGDLVAHNTADAIKSGLFYGWLSLIDGIIGKIEKQYQKEFLRIITGGYAELVSSHLDKKNILDPMLTMKGIKYIYDNYVA